jgi:hypothetical protein
MTIFPSLVKSPIIGSSTDFTFALHFDQSQKHATGIYFSNRRSVFVLSLRSGNNFVLDTSWDGISGIVSLIADTLLTM